MIYVLLLVGLIAFFSLKHVYRTEKKAQAVIVTLMFGGILALCLVTAAGMLPKSPIIIVGDLMKSIGLCYPPLK
jgi:uncharacterized membrane protein YqiK